MQEEQFMQDDRFWLLVSLQLTGEATQEELAELEAGLLQRPEMGARMEMLHDLWKMGPVDQGRREDALNKHLQRLSNHLSEPALKYETVLPEEEMTEMAAPRKR